MCRGVALFNANQSAVVFRFRVWLRFSIAADRRADGQPHLDLGGPILEAHLELDQRDLMQWRRVYGLGHLGLGDRHAGRDGDLLDHLQRERRVGVCERHCYRHRPAAPAERRADGQPQRDFCGSNLDADLELDQRYLLQQP